MSLNESIVEDAALDWLDELCHAVGHGPQLAPGEPAAERDSFSAVVLVSRLRDAIRRLNRAILRPRGASPDATSRRVERASSIILINKASMSIGRTSGATTITMTRPAAATSRLLPRTLGRFLSQRGDSSSGATGGSSLP